MKLTRAGLAVDFRRRQPCGFISHAHFDHVARHELALCTPATAALCRLRLGRLRAREMPYGEPLDWSGVRLTACPAGHCLGSAMLLAEQDGRSLLYTGDFKPGPSATAEPAELPRAEILVIESTFGQPKYRMPPRAEAVEQLLGRVEQASRQGAVAVVEAYPLGKAQEVTRLLTDRGVAVAQHRLVHQVSRVYEQFGVELGRYERFVDRLEPGRVLIVPPRVRVGEHLGRQVRIAVTGWALDERTKHRLRVDHAVPLSDHADYDELFDAVARVGPEVVYCTHGPEGFADRLREAGWDAHPLGRPSQGRLF